MQISRMSNPFGVVASELDLSKGMDSETMRTLIAALHENQILLIEQQNLSHADYVKFGYFWGRPLAYKPNPGDRREDFPEMIKIENSPNTPIRFRDGAVHWHSDSTYEEIPASVTMLYGIEAPAVGGETMLASTANAYDALSAEMKAKIDPLTAMHCLGGAPELPGEKIPFNPETTARMGIVKHPLVMRHPVTGRKSLYTSGTAYGIEGMEGEAGRELIAELRAHATKPEFISKVKIREGDIFLWDNFQTLHTATPLEYSSEDGKRRLLYRISTKGLPDLCEAKAAQSHRP